MLLDRVKGSDEQAVRGGSAFVDVAAGMPAAQSFDGDTACLHGTVGGFHIELPGQIRIAPAGTTDVEDVVLLGIEVEQSPAFEEIGL